MTDRDLLDVSRLNAEERRLWERIVSRDAESEREGPGFKIWSFGYICMLDLGRVPAVVTEYLSEHDPDNKVRQYWDNVRRARWEGRI
jgi:hypothetical protein